MEIRDEMTVADITTTIVLQLLRNFPLQVLDITDEIT
jgi:hypothetical protein